MPGKKTICVLIKKTKQGDSSIILEYNLFNQMKCELRL